MLCYASFASVYSDVYGERASTVVGPIDQDRTVYTIRGIAYLVAPVCE